MSEGSLIEDIKKDIEELLTAKRAAKSETSFNSSDDYLETQNAIQEILKDLKQKEALQLNIKSVPISSHRRFLGPLFNLYKRIIRISTEWLYQPVFDHLANFNSEILDLLKKIVIDRSKIHRELEVTKKRLQLAVHELTNQMDVEKDIIQQTLNGFWKNEFQIAIDKIHNELTETKQLLENEFQNAIDKVHNELTETKRLLENDRVESSLLRTKLSLALERKNQSPRKSSEELSDNQKLEDNILKNMNDALYFSFEQKFRGSEDDIKERQRVYLPYLKTAFEKCNVPILDLGSGRGEFLELCQEANLPAKGVDINDAMIEHCRQKKLDVEKIDLLKYLQTLEDESLSAITAFQLVEHLPPEQICHLVKLCLIKLKPEGIIILETMNPDTFASLRHFYLDLSHQKPVSSETLRFILEATGFKKVDVLFSSLVPARYRLKGEDENTRILNNLLLGHQDYAALGWK